jgi:hypothetical protein
MLTPEEAQIANELIAAYLRREEQDRLEAVKAIQDLKETKKDGIRDEV